MLKPTTRAQRLALFDLFERHRDSISSRTPGWSPWHSMSNKEKYRAFRSAFHNNGQWLGGCIPRSYGQRGRIGSVGIYYGIEPDGYTHT